jgi:nitrogenase molybdenum-iron protein alpha/beta subunit
VGIEGTRRWLLSVAGAMHRERQAEKLIDSELDWLIPRIEKIVSFCLVDRRALVVGEPFVISGLVEMLGDMGCAMAMVVVQGERRHPCNVPSDALFEPALDEVLDALLAMPQPFADLAIVSGEYARHVCGIVPVVELGFPSFGHHVLVPRPFFGFQGVANLVERIGNAMLSRS